MVLLRLVGFLTLLSLLAGCTAAPANRPAGEKRVIHMSAVEFKGAAPVEKEPFPKTAPPPGKGYVLEPPGADGRWMTETYRFEPGLVVANEGDQVELHIWGVNGAKHDTVVEGFEQRAVVKRGELTVIKFQADKPGIFRIICLDHPPSMESQLLILPRR